MTRTGGEFVGRAAERPQFDAEDPVLGGGRASPAWCASGSGSATGCSAVAIVLFVVGVVAGFTSGLTTAIVACLLVGSAVLAPAIVFGYAVKAAEREDLARGSSVREDRS